MRLAWPLLLVTSLSACSAIIDPDPARLGGGSDGGAVQGHDAAVTHDSGTMHGHDAGPMPGHDAGPRDSGLPCVVGARCEGDTLVRCAGGVETRTSCQDSGAYCAGGDCHLWVCTPGERACSDDLRGVVVCSERGDSETTTPCELGCNPTTNSCITTSPACSGLPRVSLGDTLSFNLCLETNDDTFAPTDTAGGCSTDLSAEVGDRTFVFSLDHPSDVVIELSDIDSMAAVDTVVYLRRVCDDASTQVACDDDVACEDSTLPSAGCSGFEVRQSRIVTHLEAGTYYIVADAFAYSTDRTMYRCGTVQLRVATP